MKIEVAKRDLEAALAVVSIAAGSTGNDITTHFVFRHRPDDNIVEVLANNNRLGASMPLICNVSVEDDTDAFTVESWRLNKWIGAVQDAALTLELTDGQVKATSPKGSVKFPSLDSKTFPYWDGTFGETEPGVSIPAKRFQAALAHAKLFISDKDTTTPEFTVCEIKDGSLQASDRASLTSVTLRTLTTDEEGTETYEDDLKGSNLRIHGKDLASVLQFLNTCGDEGVEIREHAKALFLIRADGGMLSVGRPRHPFPDITLDKKPDDPFWWEVKKEDLVSAINALVASASRENYKINFKLTDGMVEVSMVSVAGDTETLHLEALAHEEKEEDIPMPETGFKLAYPYLLKLLGQHKDETVRFGLNPQMKKGKHAGGYVRFRENRGADDYLTLLVWLKE